MSDPICSIVRVSGKDRLPVVTALDDVLRLTGNNVAGKAGHGSLLPGKWESVAKIIVSDPIYAIVSNPICLDDVTPFVCAA